MSRRERQERQSLIHLALERQKVPAQPPAAIPLPPPEPVREPVRGGGEERQAARMAAAEAHARAGRGHVEPETGQDGPPTLPLPQEVAAGLAAPPGASQGLPPKGPEWDRLHDPLPASPLAEFTVRLLCQAIATTGLSALRPRVIHDCRRAAQIALTGKESGR